MTSFHCGSRLLNSTVAIFNMTHTEKTERVDNTFEIRTMIKSLYILAKSQKDEATLMKSCHTFQILGTLNRKFMSSWPYPIQPLASHWSICFILTRLPYSGADTIQYFLLSLMSLSVHKNDFFKMI